VTATATVLRVERLTITFEVQARHEVEVIGAPTSVWSSGWRRFDECIQRKMLSQI
jgi:hypothetical protein